MQVLLSNLKNYNYSKFFKPINLENEYYNRIKNHRLNVQYLHGNYSPIHSHLHGLRRFNYRAMQNGKKSNGRAVDALESAQSHDTGTVHSSFKNAALSGDGAFEKIRR